MIGVEIMADADVSMNLLENLIENGLDYVGVHLGRKVKKQIIIADSYGYSHYPEKSMIIVEDIKALLEDLPVLKETQYCYDKNENILIYSIGSGEVKAFIIVKNVEQENIISIISSFSEANLAIKHYMNTEVRLKKNMVYYQKEFLKSVCIKKNLHIKDIAEKAGIELDTNNQYAIVLIKIDANEVCFEEQKLKSHLFQYANKNNMEYVIPIYWNGYFVLILSSVLKDEVLELDIDWLNIQKYINWKTAFEKEYNVNVAISIGGVYKLNDLYKSYNEARIAMLFNLIKGESSFVQNFMELGVFTHVFLQDMEQIKTFCMNSVGKLLEHDYDFDTELLVTLRVLLDCNFNWKLSAEQLFVHVNTLRYRYSKIEQLLSKDLSLSDVRVNLFVAIRVGDILNELGFLKPSYVGNIVEGYKVNCSNKKQSKALW
jgi:sugar diacid utilization regulator